MGNSSGFVADVMYMAKGKPHTQEVTFGALPRKGDIIVFHGEGMAYKYVVRSVTWHLQPGPTVAGIRHPDISRPAVDIGACIEREEEMDEW